MAKGKKGGKRITKDVLALMLEEFFSSQPGKTFSFKDIFRKLKLDTHPQKMLAIDIMEEMAWSDFLTRMSDNSYCLNRTESQTQEGVFVRKSNGKNSFLPDGGGKSVLVAERNSLFALDGDRVKVTYMARRRNHTKEAQVVEILQRKKERFVGRLRVESDLAFLEVNDGLLAGDIIVPKKRLNKGKDGYKAIVKIVKWPDQNNRYLIGEVEDVLGPSGDNDAEMNTILVQYNLPYIYPQAVEDAANKISDKITDEDIAEREDYRDVFTCTIDPRDAKDFDDALSFRQVGEDIELGVHIADVSHYVTEGSIIDQEAYARATSVYLVDRTIPMLPERLCNYICSLRPDEEKLAYSVIFTLDNDANVKNSRICRTIIRSDRRYAYEEVQKIIDEGGSKEDNNAHILLKMWELASKIRARRFENGSMKFESEEMKFHLDEKGKPIDCYFKQIGEANNLVEEYMLMANKAVAEYIGKTPKVKNSKKPESTVKKTFVYRVHDNPDPQKLEQLRAFVMKFGIKMGSTGTTGATLRTMNRLMDEVVGTDKQKLVQTVALRSMMKAKYTTHNIGHFGLAFEHYTHFTSPIRRYPDLMVHRLLTRYISGGKSVNQEKCEELCQHCSDQEIVASNAERDSIKYKMVEFMSEKVGKCYEAHISGITSYGIYCEIDENHCEGMVPMRSLHNDYYFFDENNYCLRGEHTGKVYQLGDPIRVKVANANLELKRLDFIEI